MDADGVTRLRGVIARLARQLNASSTSEGLTPSQASVLGLVVFRGPLSLGELADLEGLNPTMLSRVVGRLQELELIRRIPDPADRMMLHYEVRQALTVVIGRLSPAERTSFILHDIFGFPFDAVAGLVGRTPAACRQLARRARLSVGTGPSHAELTGAWPGSTTAASLAERFIAVCDGDDVHGLIGLLDPEAAGFPMVIGLGGGTYARADNRTAIAEARGITVFLECDLATLR